MEGTNPDMNSTMSSLKYWSSPMKCPPTKTSEFLNSTFTSPIKDKAWMNETVTSRNKQTSIYKEAISTPQESQASFSPVKQNSKNLYFILFG